jgi:hypothetical protein
MKKALVITSIASDQNPILNQWASECKENDTTFILIGDKKSPGDFNIKDCEAWGWQYQNMLPFTLLKDLPYNHYSRKNIGYLIAMSRGVDVIIETDDDNKPIENFWNKRKLSHLCNSIKDSGWVNVYRYFINSPIWSRGFPLELVNECIKPSVNSAFVTCPIQQGLADNNPDVDAIYRMTGQLPVYFYKELSLALTGKTFHPFNSQNTTWFKDAFPLLYLPTYCSFRMTDIWRSFVAQRICQEFGWGVLYHSATVIQERNEHNLLKDFKYEILGYLNNALIMERLQALVLKGDVTNMLIDCYKELISMGVIGNSESLLLKAWLNDI